MGAPKPWPTRWPEPSIPDYDSDDDVDPLEDPDYTIEDDPAEDPWRLPEEQRTPYAVTWGVTHPCNLRCDHCYDVVGHRRTDLTTDQALDVISRLARAGITFIVFSGGEPLLRKDLFTLLEACRAENIGIGMRSNATLVTEAKARRLAELNLQVAGVSLDGASETVHDRVRGDGAFRAMRNGIEALLAENIRVNLEVVLSKRNVDQAHDFVQLAEDWGVDEMNFSAITPQGRAQGLDDVLLDYATWQRVTAELYAVSKTAKIAISPSCALTGACWACVEANITCDGWVTPCYLSKRKLFHMLEVEPEDFAARLASHRADTINICGREKWIAER